MSSPAISILLPVYNGEPFLKDCIDSLLCQTFPQFELIIVNDGSTDDSEKIIQSYNDARIVYFKNEVNKGLIYTLNRGIEEAKGTYIVRMDADDICRPNRLEVQKKWMDAHTNTSVAACFSDFIDERNKPSGFYELDRKTVTAKEIKNKLPYQNCITHPSVIGRSSVFKTYKYSVNQKNIEDYDLWLRLAGDGKIIEKIPQPLLLYRIHPSSVTQTKLQKTNFFLKHFHCKRKYLAGRIKKGKINGFDLRVSIEMIADLGRAFLKKAKNIISNK